VPRDGKWEARDGETEGIGEGEAYIYERDGTRKGENYARIQQDEFDPTMREGKTQIEKGLLL
jgi:hypothetical protein